jgi:hypothetical protein
MNPKACCWEVPLARRKRRFYWGIVVTLNFASWNQLDCWLKQLERLRSWDGD